MSVRLPACVLLLLSLAPALGAQSTCIPHLTGGDRRGPAKALARSGDRVFLGAGGAVIVVDAADPEHPVEHGFANLDGVVRDVASWGWTVVAAVPGALDVVDATDPDEPRQVARLPYPAASDPLRVDARDDLAFLVAPDGLHVVDISQPVAPVEIGFVAIADARDVAVRSGRAYLLAGSAVHVLDTTNPASPIEIRSVPVPEETYKRITVAPGGGRLATWACDTDGRHDWGAVAFFDLSNASLPVLRSGLDYNDGDSCPYAMTLAAGQAYVDVGGEIEIYDLHDLSDPLLAGAFSIYGAVQLTGAAGGEHLLVAGVQQGLRIFDVDPPAEAHEVSSIDTPGESEDVLALGGLAVAVHDRGTRLLDLAHPDRPVLVGAVAAQDPPWSRIVRKGDRAYVTSNYYDLRSLDLSHPRHPRDEGLLGPYGDIPPRIEGDRLYAHDGASQAIRIFDVSNPAAPVQLGVVHLTPFLFLSDFTTSAGRLYAWEFEGYPPGQHLTIFDVSDPGAPLELGSTTTSLPSTQGESVIRGSHLFRAGPTQLSVFDVADPANPVQVVALPLPAGDPRGRRLSLYGTLLSVAPGKNELGRENFDDRLLLFDVSDPLDPQELARIDTPGDARGVSAAASEILVADGPAGFSVYATCPLFADGFESGDASAWSPVVP